MTTLHDLLSGPDARCRKVPPYGHVALVDCMPRLVPEGRTAEVAIVSAARVSLDRGVADVERDTKLVRYLMRNHHNTPLEHVRFTFEIKAPIFVARQIMRHRTASFNELSLRYTEIGEEHECFIPTELRSNSESNRQASGPITDYETITEVDLVLYETTCLLDQVRENYHRMIALGMAREQARYCLPVGTYTRFYMTIDLHNLLHFLELRLDRKHAQAETAEYAEAIAILIAPIVPIVMQAFFQLHCELV